MRNRLQKPDNWLQAIAGKMLKKQHCCCSITVLAFLNGLLVYYNSPKTATPCQGQINIEGLKTVFSFFQVSNIIYPGCFKRVQTSGTCVSKLKVTF